MCNITIEPDKSKIFFSNFRNNVFKSKINLYSILKNIKNKNKKICGIGAPARASTLINYIGLDENIIDYVLEIEGSKKIGNYIPGTKIPIMSEKKLFIDQPDFAILFSLTFQFFLPSQVLSFYSRAS